MKKQILSILLVISMVLSMMPTVFAAESTSGPCGENLTWTLDRKGTLTISGEGAMTNYEYQDTPWYSVRGQIETMIIESGVTAIGDFAFEGCYCLTSVTVPDSVTTIGDSAFSYCSSLTGVTIPDSVTAIGDFAFESCDSLTNVTIPDSVTSIGDSAFKSCASLTSVTIGDSVTTISNNTFSYCYNLTNVTIGESVTSISDSAFEDCTSLTAINVDSGNAYYKSINGVLFNKAGTTLIQCPGGKAGVYTIPDSVTTIGDSAFEDCISLTSVTIPDSVITIGDEAFVRCDSLTKVTIGDSVTTIGDSAFSYCDSLTKVTIGDSVTTIGDEAFLWCTSLTNVEIGDGVTTISDGAFACCDSLRSVSIPDSVTVIGDWAFNGCESLTSVTIPDSVTAIGDYTFRYCTSLTSVTIPDSVTTIGNEEFAFCYKLTSVTIPDSVTTIGDYAFCECTSLTSITFTGDAPKIGSYCFSNVTATAYYPAGNVTWSSHVMQDYGGIIKWVAYSSTLVNPFTDVPSDAYYANAVAWAASSGITTGTSKTTFSPNNNCTRAQIVTFLWRSQGSPEPSSKKNPFTDVKTSSYYYKAVLWAVEKGITTGTSKTTFSPDANCTRAQAVTFLWRTAGKPTASSKASQFTDLKSGAYYIDAVAWAVENKITNGISITTFSPEGTCTRGQIVTFLWRYMN